MAQRLTTTLLAIPLIPIAALATGGWTGDATLPSPAPSLPVSAAGPTSVQMRNVDFFVDPRIPLRIRHLAGTMRSLHGGTIVFDDKNSFAISISDAEVGLTGEDLSVLLNKYVFNYRGSPLSNLRIQIKGNEIIQKGTLRKIASMPFEMRGTLSLTNDGMLRIHPTHTEIIGLHVDGLMKGLGLSLGKIINLRNAKGASIAGNDIILNAQAVMPPPRIEGRITSVRTSGDEVVLTFGGDRAQSAAPIPDKGAESYMYYRGGTLQFGKLVMLDADMLITDLDPQDSFRFDLDHYQPQLVAGYSRTLASGGLEVWMRDIDKLGKAQASR